MVWQLGLTVSIVPRFKFWVTNFPFIWFSPRRIGRGSFHWQTLKTAKKESGMLFYQEVIFCLAPCLIPSLVNPSQMAGSSLTDVEGWMNEIEALKFHQWQTTHSKISMESIYTEEMSIHLHLQKFFFSNSPTYYTCKYANTHAAMYVCLWTVI